MLTDRGSRREGRGCVRRRRSAVIHERWKKGFGLGRRSGEGHGGRWDRPIRGEHGMDVGGCGLAEHKGEEGVLL